MLVMFAAAVALPYVMSSDFRSGKPAHVPPAGHEAELAPISTAVANGEPASARPLAPIAPGSLAARTSQDPAPPVRHTPRPSQDLSQVINFQVTPAWILHQWPRVSASLAALEMQGYRVALVSGTQEDDLAGALTYYFDNAEHVAQITFQGSTGDPRKLVALVTGTFGFVRAASEDPSVMIYNVKWNGEPRSELRIRTARVVRAEDARGRYELELSIRR